MPSRTSSMDDNDSEPLTMAANDRRPQPAPPASPKASSPKATNRNTKAIDKRVKQWLQMPDTDDTTSTSNSGSDLATHDPSLKRLNQQPPGANSSLSSIIEDDEATFLRQAHRWRKIRGSHHKPSRRGLHYALSSPTIGEFSPIVEDDDNEDEDADDEIKRSKPSLASTGSCPRAGVVNSVASELELFAMSELNGSPGTTPRRLPTQPPHSPFMRERMIAIASLVCAAPPTRGRDEVPTLTPEALEELKKSDAERLGYSRKTT